jgi:hypothetical protein
MRTSISSLLMPLLLAAAPLAAAEPTLGFQASFALPTGRLGDASHLDRKAGLGLGFSVPVDFGAGHMLRPRLDYLAFRRNGDKVEYRTDSMLLMADYNYFFEEERRGTYAIAGLGLHSTRRKAVRPFGPITARADEGTTGLACSLGIGHHFTPNAALEVRWLGMDMGQLGFKNSANRDAGFMGSAVVASFAYTF